MTFQLLVVLYIHMHTIKLAIQGELLNRSIKSVVIYFFKTQTITKVKYHPLAFIMSLQFIHPTGLIFVYLELFPFPHYFAKDISNWMIKGNVYQIPCRLAMRDSIVKEV